MVRTVCCTQQLEVHGSTMYFAELPWTAVQEWDVVIALCLCHKQQPASSDRDRRPHILVDPCVPTWTLKQHTATLTQCVSRQHILHLTFLVSTCRLVITIGATNRPEVLDMALRRPGRFDREIDVGVPGTRARAQMLKHCLRSITHDIPDADIDSFAADMHGFVAADVDALAQEAAMQALREYVALKVADEEGREIGTGDLSVHIAHLKHAATVIKPSALREVAIEIPKVFYRSAATSLPSAVYRVPSLDCRSRRQQLALW